MTTTFERQLPDARSLASRIMALGSVIAASIAAHPAAAMTVHARYAISYVGVPVGSVETVEAIGPSSYQTSVDASVTGIARIASDFTISMRSTGVLRGAVQPQKFTAVEVNSGETQKMQLILRDGSVARAEVIPPAKDPEQRVPVLEGHKRHVVDPASSLIMMVPLGESPVGPPACERTLHIFDGISRSDIALHFVRSEDVSTDGFSGKVAVCSLHYNPIAGHKPAAAMTRFMQSNSGIELRVAPIPGTQHLMIVAVSIPLQIGTASIQLEELQVEPSVTAPLQ